MTKMLRVLATLLVIFSLMGCGTKKNEEVKDNAVGTETETDVNDTTTEKRYYKRLGNGYQSK